MATKKIRAVLLCISAASALVAAIATLASEHATAPLKRNLARDPSAVVAADQEMVTRLIVKPRRKTGDQLAQALQWHDATDLEKTANTGMTVLHPMAGGAHVVKLDKPATLAEARVIAARLMQDDSVELVEPDRVMHAYGITPSDPGYASQWHYYAPSGSNKGGANLPNAWASTTGSPGITVAVIDTGYRQHADFAAVWPGYDFIINQFGSVVNSNDGDSRDADAQDPGDWNAAGGCGTGSSSSNSSWHGTHVTGTIAALMNNGIGGSGVAPNVKILPVRVLGRCGGHLSDIVDGMYWAAGLSVPGVPANPHPANVLNLSLGGSGACSNTEQTAVNQIVAAGKVIVVAAGNTGAVGVGSPANCTGVIAVTAHAIDGDNTHYATVGPEVAISAPGGGCGSVARASGCADGPPSGPAIYSTFNSGTNGPGADSYAMDEGTSMATPHVSGVVALMLSVNSALTPAQIKSYLQSSARPHPVGSTCTQAPYTGLCGAGLLDADGAVTYAGNLFPAISLTNASQVVAPGVTVALSSTDSAATGRSITSYAWTQMSGTSVGAINNASTANASFTAPATGTYTFKLTVTDDHSQSSSATATVRVNTAPTVPAITAKNGYAGQTLTFNVTGSDIDGDTLTYYAASSLPTGATLSAAGVFTWPNPTLGASSFAYYASDNDVNSGQGTVNITTTVAPPPPPSSGGGGSLDGSWLMVLAGIALLLRASRAYRVACRRR